MRRAAKEFESLFMYQMLKSMRSTINEAEQKDGAAFTGGLGKEIFTGLFDQELARKMSGIGHSSIAEILYRSFEKLIDAQYGVAADPPAKMLPLRQDHRTRPIEIEKRSLPIEPQGTRSIPIKSRKPAPIPLGHSSDRAPDRIRDAYGPLIDRAASLTAVDSTLIQSVIRAESSGDHKAISPAGAKGLMQLIDSTAAQYGVKEVFDPGDNILAGSRYLADLLQRFGDLRLALAAYNAGPGNVDKYGGIPPFAETRAYVDKVMRLYNQAKPANAVPETKGAADATDNLNTNRTASE